MILRCETCGELTEAIGPGPFVCEHCRGLIHRTKDGGMPEGWQDLQPHQRVNQIIPFARFIKSDQWAVLFAFRRTVSMTITRDPYTYEQLRCDIVTTSLSFLCFEVMLTVARPRINRYG